MKDTSFKIIQSICLFGAEDFRSQLSTKGWGFFFFFFNVKGSDVEKNLKFSFCNSLILVFLCNFCYFRFRVIISLFLGAFKTKLGSYYV